MLKDLKYPKSGEYRTGAEHEPICFFLKTLPVSSQFNILLGYFSSSAIHVLSLGFASFIFNGGKVRMVINHILSGKDKKAIIAGSENSEDDFDFSIRNFNQIREALDEYGVHFFNCLAWLIASNRIEIRSVKPLSNKGISHYKSGVLDDGNNKVKFKSSCNFTASGLLENLEELDIKQSWYSERDATAIDKYELYFEDIFQDKADFVEHLPYSKIEEAILDHFGNKDIQELLIEEHKLIQQKRQKSENPYLREIFEDLEKYTQNLISQPRFPYSKPRDYQAKAYKMWVDNNFKGIFAMATGTGKTLTALNCVLNQYKETDNYRAIILVPTIELVAQWKKEIEKFNFSNIILVSSKNKGWRNDLNRATILSKNDPTYSFFIVSTYRSFTSSRFQSTVRKLPKDTIFIADETHNLGSPSIQPLLDEFPIAKRIGLSATPERIYDEEGSQKVDDFFNDSRPYTYEFSMKEALDKGYLCEYYYYPHLVELNDIELEGYVALSKELAKYFDSEKQTFKEEAKKLLLLRKQIIHKASQKIDLFDSLLDKIIEEEKLNYTLIYAPEGYFKAEHFDTEAASEKLDIGENRICEFYASKIREKSPNTKVGLFTSQTQNRKNLLQEFEKSNVDVLVSMKCLDEGVDVPRTAQAIFCASTGNPRQFIQRRGRILRTHDDKTYAIIHDMVVIPSLSKMAGSLKIEKQLVENELRRVKEFAGLSINKYEAINKLDSIINLYNIDTIF